MRGPECLLRRLPSSECADERVDLPAFITTTTSLSADGGRSAGINLNPERRS